MTFDEETEMLKRVARNLYGPDVILAPMILEDIRERYRVFMADQALNEPAAA